MARIAGVDLPRNKRMEIALTYIYGIGKALSERRPQAGRHLARQAHRRPRRERRPQDPRRDRGELQGRRRSAPRRLDEHQAPDGPRLLPRPAPSSGLPVRGQRTHTNARTRKGPRKGMAAKKLRGRPREVAGERNPGWRESMAKPKPKKKVKKNVQTGIAHIQSTFNNTIVTITDVTGNVVAWSSPARAGSRARASRRRSPRSSPPRTPPRRRWSTACATSPCYVNGPGSGRESALRALQAAGFKITLIRDVTPVPHNGCRPPKRRRV